MTGLPLIGHWVDGAPWKGRRAPPHHHQPGLRRRPGRGGAGVRRRRRHAVASATTRVRRLGQGVAGQAHRGALRVPRAAGGQPRRLAAIVTREHGKTLDDARGELDRGLEVVELACGLGQLLKGDYSEGVSTGIDTHSVRAAVGRRRRHHAVQLPGDGPAVDAPAGHRLRQHLRAQAVARRTRRPSLLLAELWSRAGPARGRVLRRPGRPRGRRRAAHPPRRTRRQLCRLDPGRPPRLRDRGRARQAGPGPRRRQEPHGRAARRRPRRGGRRRGQRRLRLGRRALHGGLRGRRRRATCGDDLVERIRSRASGSRSAPARTRLGDGPARSPASTATGSRPTSTRRWPTAPTSCVDGRGVTRAAAAEGYWLGPCLIDGVSAGMTVYDDEIFGPVLSVVRVGDLRRGARAGQRRPVRQRRGHLHRATGRPPGAIPAEVEVGMVGVNVRSRCPWRYHSSAAGRARSSATPMSTAPTGCGSTPGDGGHQPLGCAQGRS